MKLIKYIDTMFSNPSVIKRDDSWLGFITILVTAICVIRHASMPDWIGQGYPAFDAFGKVAIRVTDVFFQFFLFLAGYLLFRGTPRNPDLKWFGRKYLCGLKVIVIPFLIANLFSWCVYAAAYKFAPSMMSGFLDSDWKDPLFALWKGPINLSLWLLREVIVTLLLFPVLYYLIRYTWGVATVALGVLWGFGIVPAPLFCLSIGATLAILPIHSQRFSDWRASHPLPAPSDYFNWCYFIFLYHYIPQLVMKKIGVMLLPTINGGGLIAVWLLNALLLAAGLSAIYLLLRRFTPKLLSIIVGSN